MAAIGPQRGRGRLAHRESADARYGPLWAVRGKKFNTTTGDDEALRTVELVKRNFSASRPNQLSIADLIYVSAWRGFAYVACIIDLSARMIVGWCVSGSLRTDLPLTALVQILFSARAPAAWCIIQTTAPKKNSISYTERLVGAGIRPSMGSVDDAYDKRYGRVRDRPLQDRSDQKMLTSEASTSR